MCVNTVIRNEHNVKRGMLQEMSILFVSGMLEGKIIIVHVERIFRTECFVCNSGVLKEQNKLCVTRNISENDCKVSEESITRDEQN